MAAAWSCSAASRRAACSARGRAGSRCASLGSLPDARPRVYAGLVLAPQIVAAQRTIGVAPVQPRRKAIRDASSSAGCTRLSTSLQLIPLLGGLLLLFFELKD